MTNGFGRDTSYYQGALLDNLPSILAYWGVDLRCRYANRAYERWFNVDAAGLIGTSLPDVIGPELFALNEPYIRAVLRGEMQSFERVVAAPGGTRHALVTYIPDLADGAVVGVVVQVTEVTTLKDTEVALQSRVEALLVAQAATLALQRNEAQLRELFMRAFDGIFIADLEGRFIDVNAAGCSLLGYTRDEFLGKTVLCLLLPGEVERLRLARAQLLAGGVQVEEWTLRHKDGSFMPVEMSVKIMSDGRWVGFVRDIGEHKRALEVTRSMTEELELRVAQRTAQLRRLGADLEAAESRERRQIARDLHDDLGQTLAAAQIRLAGLCNDARADVRDAANEVDALIAAANRSTRSLAARLVPAVLYELGLCPALAWLGEEIEQTFGLRVTVVDDGQPKPLSQEARSILYRAVRELLVNVAKHARTDVAVVETLRLGERIVVSVSDAGVGVDPALLSATPRRGLGLLSVRERLSFIGGTAEVRSVPGDGTVAVLSALLATDEFLAAERDT